MCNLLCRILSLCCSFLTLPPFSPPPACLSACSNLPLSEHSRIAQDHLSTHKPNKLQKLNICSNITNTSVRSTNPGSRFQRRLAYRSDAFLCSIIPIQGVGIAIDYSWSHPLLLKISCIWALSIWSSKCITCSASRKCLPSSLSGRETASPLQLVAAISSSQDQSIQAGAGELSYRNGIPCQLVI